MLNDIKYFLYYPSIEFRSMNWLKTSLLYWDAVYRIVPDSYEPEDNDTVKEAIDNNLVRPISLEKDDFIRISNEFRKFVSKLPFTPAGFDGTSTERLHKDKIDDRLYEFLERLSVKIDSEGFLHLPPGLARWYMLYLSKSVAGRRNIATATDVIDVWTVTPYFKERGNFGERVYSEDAKGY